MQLKSILQTNSTLLLLLYLATILLLVVLPINGESSSLNNNYTLGLRWDYIIHALVYIPLPFLLFNTKIKLWLGIVLALALASGFEFIQMGLSYRAFNVNDLVANGIGVLLGLIAAMILTKIKFVKLINLD